MDPELKREVEHLLREERKIEAIRLVMDRLGVGLAAAKSAVEYLASTPGMPRPEWRSEIGEFLQQGNKIEAIKRYRSVHQVGLKEALEAVERYQSTGHFPEAPAVSQQAPPDPDGLDWRALVWAAIRAGHKIDAIKLLRANTGLGLREAKDAVEQAEVTGVLQGAAEVTEPWVLAVREAVRTGEIDTAIRLYRSSTGADFEMAKARVEAMRGAAPVLRTSPGARLPPVAPISAPPETSAKPTPRSSPIPTSSTDLIGSSPTMDSGKRPWWKFWG